MTSEIVQLLLKLGLTEYEAKAYLSLLKENPVNGYSLSKNSGIPRSRIYDILQSLIVKGLVFKSLDDASKFYPLDLELFLNRVERESQEVLTSFKTLVVSYLGSRSDAGSIKQIIGQDNIIKIARDMIAGARQRISLYIWEPEAELFYPTLIKASSRGTFIRGIAFGEFKNNPLNLQIHRRPKRIFSELKERWLIVTKDNSSVLASVISRGPESSGTLSTDPGVVLMFEDYILHDIMLNYLLSEFTGEERAAMESKLDKMRAWFNLVNINNLEG